MTDVHTPVPPDGWRALAMAARFNAVAAPCDKARDSWLDCAAMCNLLSKGTAREEDAELAYLTARAAMTCETTRRRLS